jgi:hypothetical protein
VPARVLNLWLNLSLAGTTRLELATSAVTVSGLQLLSTTWKSTHGTASHWKDIIDNANVYRDAYRGCTVNRTDRAVNFHFARDSGAMPEIECLQGRKDLSRLDRFHSAWSNP